ncbi:unnamed protein product, partial [Pocillopora meandrina]
WNFRNVAVKSEGPAVTLKITSTNKREYSIDLTLAIKEKTWPEDAEEWTTRCRNVNFMSQSLRIRKALYTNCLSSAGTDFCQFVNHSK